MRCAQSCFGSVDTYQILITSFLLKVEEFKLLWLSLVCCRLQSIDLWCPGFCVLHHIYSIFFPSLSFPQYRAVQDTLLFNCLRKGGGGWAVNEQLTVSVSSEPSSCVSSRLSSHMEGGMASLSRGRQPSSQRNRQLGSNKVEKHILYANEFPSSRSRFWLGPTTLQTLLLLLLIPFV